MIAPIVPMGPMKAPRAVDDDPGPANLGKPTRIQEDDR
jgi:hypothetical protein